WLRLSRDTLIVMLGELEPFSCWCWWDVWLGPSSPSTRSTAWMAMGSSGAAPSACTSVGRAAGLREPVYIPMPSAAISAGDGLLELSILECPVRLAIQREQAAACATPWRVV